MGDGFLLQQKSSAAGFHLKLWNNDMGDDLSGVLAQYSMYPLIFLAVLLHDHQSCYCGTLEAIFSIIHVHQNKSGVFKHVLVQKVTQEPESAKLLLLLPPRCLLRGSR